MLIFFMVSISNANFHCNTVHITLHYIKIEYALTNLKFLRQSSKLIMTDTSEYHSYLQSG